MADVPANGDLGNLNRTSLPGRHLFGKSDNRVVWPANRGQAGAPFSLRELPPNFSFFQTVLTTSLNASIAAFVSVVSAETHRGDACGRNFSRRILSRVRVAVTTTSAGYWAWSYSTISCKNGESTFTTTVGPSGSSHPATHECAFSEACSRLQVATRGRQSCSSMANS